MPAETSVRPATAADAGALGRVQAASWAADYARLLPSEVLTRWSPDRLADQWRAALEGPGRAAHVLVAQAAERVVGVAAAGPASDPDCEPARDAEVHLLLVDPAERGAGHGSRLLNATADVLGAAGFGRLLSWLAEADGPGIAFLAAAGWRPDGARRTLDLHGDGAVLVEQARWHAAIGTPPEEPACGG